MTTGGEPVRRVGGRRSTVTVRHAGLGADARKELEDEGLQLLQFLGVAAGDVRFA